MREGILMLRLICPRCRKDFYRADIKSFDRCPYCNIIFSGKYGSDKRSEGRIGQETPFVFSYEGRHLGATTVDISKKGLGIKIFNGPPIAENDTIDLQIGELQIKAKVMWVRTQPGSLMAGLTKLN